jgi:hypothetical protein
MTEPQLSLLGTPPSILNVSLPALWPLHTRRGSLVGLSGDVSAVSLQIDSALAKVCTGNFKLVCLEHFWITDTSRIWNSFSISESKTRILGTAKQSQVVSGTSLRAFIAPKGRSSCLSIVTLDGTVDWNITQRSALLAWTGPTLSVSPRLSTTAVSEIESY